MNSQITSPDWGDVVPEMKAPANRVDGSRITGPSYDERHPIIRLRRTLQNPWTGARTFEQMQDDYVTGKISPDQMGEFMQHVDPAAKQRVYLDYLMHPPQKEFVDPAPINPYSSFKKSADRDVII